LSIYARLRRAIHIEPVCLCNNGALMTDTSGIHLTITNNVARIALARPARRNALDANAWRALADACTRIAANDDIRAVVLMGEGLHFCVGADIHEMREHIGNAAWMQTNQAEIGNALDRYANLPQPTLAVIRGSCYGGGAALAVSSDFRIASIDTKIAITPAKLGLTYRLVDCLRVQQLIGPARTREMLMLAREIDANTALNWGLVGETCEADQLESRASAWVSGILALSSYSQRGIKKTLLKIRDGAIADDGETRKIFQDAFSGTDFQRAADAFTKR
jgi:enoyl-CoA hydratase/carnithine racemase